MTMRAPEDLDWLEYINADGSWSTAFGQHCRVEGAGAFAGGMESTALGRGSIAYGAKALATGIGEVALGEEYPTARPNDLVFVGENTLYMACEVTISATRYAGIDAPDGTRFLRDDFTWSTTWSTTTLGGVAALRCWCGWGDESGFDMHEAIGELVQHERSPHTFDLADERHLPFEERRLYVNAARRFTIIAPQQLHQIERLFRAYRSASRPLPMVSTHEDASRLLVWCDRIIPTVALRHIWWIESWIRSANELLETLEPARDRSA